MIATQFLHSFGQSIWLDNITRDLLDTGTLHHDIGELPVTGLTSNPSILNHAIQKSAATAGSDRRVLSSVMTRAPRCASLP